MEWLYQPWPWFVAGPLIALVMFLLLLLGRQFGISSNLRTMCSIGGAGKLNEFFNHGWKKETWNLIVALGAIIGGFVSSKYLSNNEVILNPKIANKLTEDYGIESAGSHYLPEEIFSTTQLGSPIMVLLLLAGGFLVGFGARYAGGCTSGHAISGLSNLQLPSLITVVGFFVGGLVMIHGLFPLLFG